MISAKKKAVIHVAKVKLQMADEAYREMLRRVAGVATSRDLDDALFDKIMAEFERLGFRQVSRPIGADERVGMATPAQLGRMRAIWRECFAVDDERAMNRWVKNHFHVDDIRFLPLTRAAACVQVMERMLDKYQRRRTKAKESSDAQS